MKTTLKEITQPIQEQSSACFVNDVHSQLNATAIGVLWQAQSIADVQRVVLHADASRQPMAIAGGRHAMGGQQFQSGGLLLDMRAMNRILSFNQTDGLIVVQAGITWPTLIDYLVMTQQGIKPGWTIAQKQTGCDDLTLGGAASANVHGRGLAMRPFIQDIESLKLILSDGSQVFCSRSQNSELFRLCIGGYGLFGVIVEVTLRLVRRCRLERHVQLVTANVLVDEVEHQLKGGATYGDFQFAIDPRSDDFLHAGILSTYHPIGVPSGAEKSNANLTSDDWHELLYLAHTDKKSAFKRYCQHYLKTDRQIYGSDRFQLSTYLPNYHAQIDHRCNSSTPGSEIIAEFYVPRQNLTTFLRSAANILRAQSADVIYGTVRFIEEDNESFLPWAKQRYACVVLNLHTRHTADEIAQVATTFRTLIDAAANCGGSFYLTYNRAATRQQVDCCYPQFANFVAEKSHYDPKHMFLSDWYLHYR